MTKIKNKEIIQSYILTTAKYDFSVYEKRILYRIVELNQKFIEGISLNEKYKIDITQLGNAEYTMPISHFLKQEDTNNHKEVKKAFLSLKKKEILYEDDNIWASLNIIALPKFIKYSEVVTFTIDSLIFNALLDFSKGFRKFELTIAMNFESTYSMRFYELFSNKKTPINYSI